ncbi:MAG: YigZ family protein [Lachnospiraceae bacterium]
MKIIDTGARCEITEKKSRFIATICPVFSEEEAITFIASVKKEFRDAKHNCYAFTIGDHNELTRYSDDGEPAQTAGKPMLDILLHEEIHNAAVVVTRYFGGILLGTGGLIRAYQKAVAEALLHAGTAEKQSGILCEIETEYSDYQKLSYLLEKNNIPVIESTFTEKVTIHVLFLEEYYAHMNHLMTEEFSGRIRYRILEHVEFTIIDQEIKFLQRSAKEPEL